MSERVRRLAAHYPGVTIGRGEHGEYLVCPECGDAARPAPPVRWAPANGPTPAWSHMDGEPLCPVIGDTGYQPATTPSTDQEWCDEYGCPCDRYEDVVDDVHDGRTCICACTTCGCRTAPGLPSPERSKPSFPLLVQRRLYQTISLGRDLS